MYEPVKFGLVLHQFGPFELEDVLDFLKTTVDAPAVIMMNLINYCEVMCFVIVDIRPVRISQILVVVFCIISRLIVFFLRQSNIDFSLLQYP